jgi:long-chain acyl-CoA synthetase
MMHEDPQVDIDCLTEIKPPSRLEAKETRLMSDAEGSKPATPRTLCELFYRAVDSSDKEDRLLYKREGHWRAISTASLRDSVEEIALGLREFGLSRGDCLALISENRPEWAIVDLAALTIGAVVVPLYTTLPPAQLMHALQESEARMLVASRAALAERILPELERTSLRHVFVMDETPLARTLRWNELRHSGQAALKRDPGAARREAEKARPEDVATLIYTAGTTGEPKGVLLTHANIVFNVLACAKAFTRLNPTDVTLSFLPLSHIFERTGGQFLMLHLGLTIAYAEGPERIAENLLEIRPTVLYAVPRFFEKIHARAQAALAAASPIRRFAARIAFAIGRKRFRARIQGRRLGIGARAGCALAHRLLLSKLKDALGGRVHTLVSGGAPLAIELIEFFGAAGLVIQEGYGLTETSPVVSVNRWEQIKPGSVGKALPGVEVRLAEDGEILVRGPLVMKGYHRHPKETVEVVDREGFFHTGDLGVIDAEGFLNLVGRKKDLIVTAGGKNVAPQPIEEVLKRDPLFSEVVLVGNRRHFIAALIVPSFERLEQWAGDRGLGWRTREQLVKHPEVVRHFMRRIEEMTPHLAPFESVKRIVLLSNEFAIETGELTPKLSLRRQVVEKKHKSLLDDLYAEAERERSAG